MPELIDGILYDTDNGYEYTVTSCEEGIENAVIRLTVNGLPVCGIREQAFRHCETLKTVSFVDEPDLLIAYEKGFEIGGNAFAYCTALTEIILPEHTHLICTGAFYSCTSLKKAVIPKCYVSDYAFSDCEALTDISPLYNISEGVFSHCKSLTALPISDGVEEIEGDAFEHCYSLVNITIPKSVKRIGSLAFRSCRGLKSVTFEDTVGWYSHNRYVRKEFPIDVTDPIDNANALSRMDFDDGISAWYKR